MKIIKFRPLRRIKKTGKITVASYMQWRKVKTADYNEFTLVVDGDYITFPKDELVYNHKGENLFWRNYNPDEIPLYKGGGFRQKEWRTDYGYYCAKGLDCDGVPTFTHFTAEDIFNSKVDMKDFEPLTVNMVTWWFGWFLYNLENNELKYNE